MIYDWVARFDLFLLDFDGLLVNTEKLHFLSYKQMVESLGFNFPIDYSTYCSGAHISTEALKDLIYTRCENLFQTYPDWTKIREIKQQIYLQHLQNGNIELMKGVDILIQSICHFGKRACIVTNSPFEQISLVEEKLPELKKISYRITREDYKIPKPDGDSYKTAIKKYGLTNDKIIGFEDSTKGVQALLDADVYAIEINAEPGISLAQKKFTDFLSVSLTSI